MADETKNLNIGIVTNYDGAGAGKATEELEQLTNTGRGLATAVPDLDAKTKQFVITTEAEYLAVQKAHAAVSAKIPVLEAAGKSTADFRQAQENLSAALSTNEALLIAEKIEQRAAAAASLENAVAQKGLAEAATLSTTSMREMTVIARELASGNFSRLPGSASILAGQFNLLKYVFSAAGAGVIGAGAAFYLLYQHLQSVNAELDKTLSEMDRLNLQQHARAIQSVADAWGNAQSALGKYYAEMDTAGKDRDPIATQLKNIKQLRDAQLDATKQEIEALGRREVARLRAEGASPEQIAAAEERTRRRTADIDAQKQHEDGVGDLEREQTKRLADRDKLQRDYLAAQKTANDAKAAKASHDARLQEFSDLLNPTTKSGAERAAKQKEIDDKKSQADALSDQVPVPGVIGVYQENAQKKKLLAEAADAQTQLDNQRALAEQGIRDLKSSQFGVDRAADASAIRAERAKRASTDNQDRLTDIPGELDQARKVEAVKSTENLVDSAAQTGTQSSTVAQDIASHHASLNDGITQLNAAQAKGRELAAAAKNAATEHNASLNIILEALNDLRRDNAQLAAQISRARSNSDLY